MTLTASNMFFNNIIGLIERIRDSQKESIDKASGILAGCVADGRLIYVWGPGGHSSIAAEDVLYRKGELAAVNPIIDPGISLSHGAVREINGLERVAGLGKVIVKYNRIKKGDVIVIGSAYGVNPVLIEAVMECRELGARVISITSPLFSDNTTFDGAMHESRKVLYELSDYYIDCCVPYGDAVVDIEGLDMKVSPVATIMVLVSLKALLSETMEKLAKMGIKPPVWTNSLQEGGIESNAGYIEKIWGKVKSL